MTRAVAKADEFWKAATSGSRAYVHAHPFLNLFCFRDTVLPGIFKKVDLYLYTGLYLIVLTVRAWHAQYDVTCKPSSFRVEDTLLAVAIIFVMTLIIMSFNINEVIF